MPYTLKSRGEQYYLSINLDWDWEVAYWVEMLDATPQELHEAVKAVGSEVSAVRAYLARDPTRAKEAADPTADAEADPPEIAAGLS